MVNALESMPNGGVLTIQTDMCKKHEGCVAVYIIDTGCGIDDENMAKIFEPFVGGCNKFVDFCATTGEILLGRVGVWVGGIDVFSNFG